MILVVILAGCVRGNLKPSMAYESRLAVPRAPLEVSLDVKVTIEEPPSRDGLLDETAPSDDALLASSLERSLRADLVANGPFSIAEGKADARLRLRVTAMAGGSDTAWRSIPPWLWTLLGLPSYSRELVVTVDAQLEKASGQTLARAAARGECTRWTGLYYQWTVDYACAVRPALEALREQLAASTPGRKGEVQSPPPVDAPSAPAEAGRASGPVVVVFDVEDARGRGRKTVAGQLADYLSVRLSAALGFRAVPRDQVRAELAREKTKGYAACFDERCQVELGKALAAEKSVSTKVLRVGKTCAMTTSVYDLRTETTERAASVKTACSEDALMGAVDALVESLRSGAGAP
jgi:hypothetical protein